MVPLTLLQCPFSDRAVDPDRVCEMAEYSCDGGGVADAVRFADRRTSTRHEVSVWRTATCSR